jgi:hypothetical protein
MPGDRLPRDSSVQKFVRPEPFLGVPMHNTKKIDAG